MNICTIATEGEWVENHLPRWLRHVKKNCPDAKVYLILACNDENLLHPHYKAISEFDGVKVYPLGVADRTWFNEIRMYATEIFDVDDMLYLDCDCDVLEDISDIPKQSDKALMFVKSPIIHPSYYNISQELGYGIPEWVADNCLLYMRRSFLKEYKKARAKVRKIKNNPRVVGTMNFNIMLKDNPDIWQELPEEYGTIWWNADKWRFAKIIQYCSENGQHKRMNLERVWRTHEEA
ncbi:MAG: hypothetical protein D4S01_10460 [Dehalococcoidia bacterium]|nr:MAG: hypothetical protein D4S01_10460 [Dehalococcoidia bacterium]